MRLLRRNSNGGFSLTTFLSNNAPRYAILSHTWESNDQEVTFEDVTNSTGKGKAGHRKIQFCHEQAKKDGFQYFWVDSRCTIQTHYRGQCTTKTAASAAETDENHHRASDAYLSSSIFKFLVIFPLTGLPCANLTVSGQVPTDCFGLEGD